MQDTNHLDIKLTDPQPSGLGGWLILPSIGLIVSPLLMLRTFYEHYLPLMNMEALQILSNPALPSYNPRLLPVIGVEVVVNLSYFFYTLAIIPKFFRKAASAPKLMAIFCASAVAVQFLDMIFVLFATPTSSFEGGLARDTIKAAISAAIWIPYFMKSVRVKNTFGKNAFSKSEVLS